MPKPTEVPHWATSATGIAATTNPPGGKKDDGWASAEKPKMQFFNWWQNLIGKWVSWLQGTADQLELATITNAQLRATPAGATSLAGIAYNGALRLVAVGDGGGGVNPKIATSDDGGITWTVRVDNMGATSPLAIGWNGALFVVVGYGGTIVTSPDGVTWTARVSGVAQNLGSVAWSPTLGLWCVSEANAKMLTSPDGIVWTDRATGLPGGVGSSFVVWGAGPALFLATTPGVNPATCSATSPDGINWTVRALPEAQPGNPGYAPFATPVFIHTSNTNKLYTSPDGINWTQRMAGFPGILPPWLFTGLTMVAYGQSNLLVTSADGVTWTTRPYPFAENDVVKAVVAAFGGIALAGSTGKTWMGFRAPAS